MSIIAERIRRYMSDPRSYDFETLALELFRYQWAYNDAYRRLAVASGVDYNAVISWKSIPPVSTTVFKHLVLTCGDPTVVFRTSGTSRGREVRGAHHLVDTGLYRESLLRTFRRFVLTQPTRLAILAPMPSWAPDSSLAFMMQTVLTEIGEPGSIVALGPDGLDLPLLIRLFDDSVRDGKPLALLGTSLAFHHLVSRLDLESRTWRLIPGSRIMDTGGSKGLDREISRAAQLATYERVLGIPAGHVVNEYGMTEMASQFYDDSLIGRDPEVKIGPHWVRTRIIDPATGLEVAPGDTGLLVHLDLANVDSVAAIETEDLGFARGAGFVLVGRSEGAEPRGCSLAADALFSPGDA